MAAVRPPLDSATGERPMSIVVDRYELGPTGTNCYVVRASRSAEEAVVVDPSGDAAQLRLELAQVGARCSAILITHGHWDHLLGVAELAEGTGAPVHMAEDEQAMLENLPDLVPAGVPARTFKPDVLLAGDETLQLAGITFETPRGTHDILPAEQPLWRLVTAEVDRLCSLYGYRPVQTPVFEDTALFQRTSGAGSDIVHKEMYTFEDKGGRSLTLRPEATAPIARAYLEHGLHREGQPAKLYTLGPMYRYTAPQRGNFREFWQLSVEAIGSDDPALDAEVIQVYDELLA